MTNNQGLEAIPSDATQEQPREAESRREHRQPPSFFWPAVLIGAGVLLLLSNLGYLPSSSWNLVWRLWPLLLIAAGIDVLIGRRSLFGAVVSGLLILMLIGGAVLIVLFAQDIPALSQMAQGPEWQIEQVQYPLDGVESASVMIDWSSLPGHLGALTDSRNLIEGTIAYRGDLVFDVDTRGDQVMVELDTVQDGLVLWPPFPAGLGETAERRWDVALSPDVPLRLSLDVGSGSYVVDLTELQVSDLFIMGGSGSTDLSLPATRSSRVTIDGGSGSMDVSVPRSVGARVDLDSGSGSFNPDRRFRLVTGERDGDGVWETENFDTAEHSIEFEIDQGSGSLSID